MEYFKKIKLDIPWINPEYDLSGLQKKYEIFPIHKIFQLDLVALNPALIDWFADHDIIIKAYIFLTPPFKKSLIHIDGNTLHDCWAINWAWGSDNHIMNWYSASNTPNSDSGGTNAGTTYKSWNENEVIKVASTTINSPTICNIGSPHRVENFSSSTRWSISIRPQLFTRWETAMSVFNKEIEEYNNGC
jgi:hypothetical protein